MPSNIVNQTLFVNGMHCASCASVITRKLQKLEGVDSCQINYGSEKAKISYNPKKTSLSEMNKEIEKLGYSLSAGSEHSIDMSHSTDHQMDHSAHAGHDMMTPLTSDQTVKERKLRDLQKLRRQIMIMIPFIIISIFVMIWEIGSQSLSIFRPMPEVVETFFHHLLPLFATYTLFVVGTPYIQAVGRFARYRVANMDSLVGIGTLSAFIYSFVLSAFENVLSPYINTQHTYYDVTIVVIGFITLGKYLEARSKLKTGEAIEQLLHLQAKSALVIRDGKEIEIPLEHVVVGDVIRVKPGQKIPTDGEIIEGSSAIDESMISGEPLPVDKTIGDTVIGATMNKQGSLKIKATKVGNDTLLSQIITMVEEAQSSKAPIEKLADQISAVFVPTVLALAFTALIVWLVIGSQLLGMSQAVTLGIMSFVGILVIACPCAMGLATPTAVIVGVGKAAQHGILIKNAENLEKFSSINMIVMDKTGTVTQGKPTLTDVITSTDCIERDAIRIIASLESHSEHPLAQAIVEKAKDTHIQLDQVDDFSILEGKGVVGKINTEKYYAGNIALAEELNLTVDHHLLDQFTLQGKTPIILMTKKKILAHIAVADVVKNDAAQVIKQLHTMGIQAAMLTGDNKKTAEYIAQKVGIDRVIAQVLPADKAHHIELLQKEGYRVAMVGDGINDAPALATADVGVAMGTGTDVAIESAGITLLSGHLSKLPQALRLSHVTMQTIRQNLFWAFFYNVISIPVAAGLLYPLFGIMLNPAVAGGAMAFSSVSVVLNSLRLKRVSL